MEITGERRLTASPDRIWSALNDAMTLRTCLPSCRSLEPEGAGRFRYTAEVRIGSRPAVASGSLVMIDAAPPAGYRIEATVHVGDAGSANGEATVLLHQDGDATTLSYVGTAELNGRMAEDVIGPHAAAIEQVIARFLDNLAATVAAPAPVAADGLPAAIAAIPTTARLPFHVPARILGFPAFAWVGAAVFFFIVYNLFVG